MIIPPFQHRFKQLRATNNHIQCALDIGAYRGDFTETIRSVWPTCLVHQIEADERQRQYLQNNAIYSLLGDREEKDIPFYTLNDTKITTGSSIFLENTAHYNSSSTVTIYKTMTTLDSLAEKYRFAGDWQNHGLIKIDTQGSELLILNGAQKFLSGRNPRYILLECSILEYNIGAPRIDQIINYMKTSQYNIVDIFDLSYDNSGSLLQTDILFERNT